MGQGVPGFQRRYHNTKDFRRCSKPSEDVQSLLKIAEVETALTFPSLSLGMATTKHDLPPSAFCLKKEVSSLHIVFILGFDFTYFWEILSSKAATTHIFQSDMRIWPLKVHRTKVLIPRCETRA